MKSCTTSATSESLWSSIVEDDPHTGVFSKQTVCDDMPRVITEGALPIWTVTREMAKVLAEQAVVVDAPILGVSWGMLSTVGTLIFRTVNPNMPCGVAMKTNSLCSCNHW